MANNTAAEAFAHRLRELLGASGHSVRSFGRKVDPDDPERGRRRVQRHLSGKHLPSTSSRDGYAEALGVDREALPLPDDQDGDSVEAMAREARAQARGLQRLAVKLEALGGQA